MLNKLKDELTVKNFRYYKNINIAFDELHISADGFTSYNLIEEMMTIVELVDLEIYIVEHLNDNCISIKLK